MRPYLVEGEGAPLDAVRYFMNRWQHDSKPHIVADSAFGSFSLLQEIHDWGGYATLSVPINVNAFLWKVLSINSPANSWRSAVNGNIIAASSTMNDKNNKIVHKQIISNGYSSKLLFKEVDTLHVNENIDNIPIFTIESLNNHKNEELKSICNKYNIKKGKKKEDYINNIMARVNTVHNKVGEMHQLNNYIKSQYFSTPALLHDFYRSHFNLIDVSDGYWYDVNNSHANHNWKSKMIFNIIKYSIINIWVYVSKKQWMTWIDFREYLAKELITFYETEYN